MSEIRPRADCQYCEQTFDTPIEWAGHITATHPEAVMRDGAIFAKVRTPQPEPEVAKAQLRKLYVLQQAPSLAAAIIRSKGEMKAARVEAGADSIEDCGWASVRLAQAIYDEATK